MLLVVFSKATARNDLIITVESFIVLYLTYLPV